MGTLATVMPIMQRPAVRLVLVPLTSSSSGQKTMHPHQKNVQMTILWHKNATGLKPMLQLRLPEMMATNISMCNKLAENVHCDGLKADNLQKPPFTDFKDCCEYCNASSTKAEEQMDCVAKKDCGAPPATHTT